MSSANECHHSVTLKLYEPAPSPPELTFEEYEVFVSERASAEQRYSEAMGAHEEWKVEWAKEAQLEKLKADKEARKKEEERKVAEKKKEEEKQAAILRAKQEAEDKQKKLAALKAEKEAADATAEKKKKDDLKKEEKRLRKKKKKMEKAVKAMDTVRSEKDKAAAKAAESALVNEEKGTDVDTERELSEGVKEKALKKLKEVRDGKQKATAPAGPKRKCATKSASVVEESDGESRPGPRKRVKVEVLGPVEGEEEFNGSKRCMCCHQDVAHCFVCPASKKLIRGWTYLRCKAKKAACSLNKGTASALTISSEDVSELLQKLAHMVETLSNKVDILTGQVVSLGGHVDNLVDDFHSEAINSLEKLISNMEEWQASCMELKDLGSVNSEALQRVMVWQLDEDMAQLRVKGPAKPEKMNADNPYEVANSATCSKPPGTSSTSWKANLWKHNCDDFLVEDSDLGEKVLDGKVWKSRKPYGKDLGIPVLDSLFVLDSESVGATTSEEEDEESEEGLESTEDNKDAPVGGAKDVEMGEVAGVVDA
ncbi:uncharacterized protein ARMOST_03423 [Armillaria ostoyae]|uniref:Uncharacterized protein n=1 Tax=Armillaria ostoyae TaxID=47428 RepID=A0A284QUP3_ARMOS|nr:uncharacterized protein ARMOST_03423 [Armillaria ostoyae]